MLDVVSRASNEASVDKLAKSRLDVPSHSYQYTFAANPNWSKFYSGGKEIHEYLKDVVWRYDVAKYVKFRHRFQGATWDNENQQWVFEIMDLASGQVRLQSI